MQTLRMVDNTQKRLTAISESLGIGALGRHILLCAEQSTPRCCSAEEGRVVWRYLKGRLKELDLASAPAPWPEARSRSIVNRWPGSSTSPRSGRSWRAAPLLPRGEVSARGRVLNTVADLLQQFRIHGQVEKHQMPGKLEVAALTAYFRADQQHGAVGFGKPGGVTIPLHQGHAFVETADFDIGPFFQQPHQGLDLLRRSTDQKYLLISMPTKIARQPGDPGIVVHHPLLLLLNQPAVL